MGSVNSCIHRELDREIRRLSLITGLSKSDCSKLILKGYLNNKNNKKNEGMNYGFN